MDRKSKAWGRESSFEAIAVLQVSGKNPNQGIGSENVQEGKDVSAVEVVELTTLSRSGF